MERELAGQGPGTTLTVGRGYWLLSRSRYQQLIRLAIFPIISLKGDRHVLVFSRKVGQSIAIGESVTVTIVNIRGQHVRIGVSAPNDMPVSRGEIPHSAAGEFNSYSGSLQKGTIACSRKTGQRILLGNDVSLEVIGIAADSVRLGIDAPPDIRVIRTELTATSAPPVELQVYIPKAQPVVEYQSIERFRQQLIHAKLGANPQVAYQSDVRWRSRSRCWARTTTPLVS